MKFNRIVRTAWVAAASLAMGLGLTSCSRDYTVAYVYSVSASNGNVSGYAIDYQSGVLTQLSGSPFQSQLTNPTTVVAAPNGKSIYVIGGSQNSAVEDFSVGTDGKLYGQATTNLTGTYPTAAAIDTTGTFLYVTFTYQLGFGPASPGPGGVTIFPIGTDGTLGSPVTVNGLNYVPTGNNPSGIAVSAPVCSTTPLISGNTACSGGADNVYVYVIDQEASPNATVLGFSQNTSTGALTQLSGTTFSSTLNTYQGVHAGVTPSGVAVDPTARFVYVTDKTSNQILGYQISSVGSGALAGNLTPLISSPFGTGQYPVSLTIDPRGKYLYTANYNSSSVSSFTIDQADGSLSGVAAGSFTTATNPTCITIDPSLGIYLYTSNYLDNSISGALLNGNTGALNAVTETPFTTQPLPSCLVSVPNGPRSQSLPNP